MQERYNRTIRKLVEAERLSVSVSKDQVMKRVSKTLQANTNVESTDIMNNTAVGAALKATTSGLKVCCEGQAI
jgi:hypothetical protein